MRNVRLALAVLVESELLDQLDSLDRTDSPVTMDVLEAPETLVLTPRREKLSPDPKTSASTALPDLPALLDRLDPRVLLVLLELPETEDRTVDPAHPEPLDLLVLLEPQETMVNLEDLELLDRFVRYPHLLDPRDLMERLELRDLLDPMESPETREETDSLDLRETVDKMELLARRELLESLEREERPALEVLAIIVRHQGLLPDTEDLQ